MSEPRFTPLLVVEYGEKDRVPWLKVSVTTEVRTDQLGHTSRPIYNGPAPRIVNDIRVESAELPA